MSSNTEFKKNTYKVLTKDSLKILNRDALKRQYREPHSVQYIQANRLQAIMNSQPDDILYLIAGNFMCNDYDVRCRIVLSEDGITGMVDIPVDIFNRIPTLEVDPNALESEA
jgi:uncharacterized iron-regulated protein